MNATLQNLLNELEQVISALNSLPSDEPFSIVHGNWSFPSISKNDLIKKASDVAETIRLHGPDDLGTQEKILADYVRRLSFVRGSTIPNMWANNAGAGASAFLQTIDGLTQALRPVLKNSTEIISELSKATRSITARLRALDTRLSDAEPRSARLSEMVARIEQAYEAADQLPTDLQQLAEDRQNVKELLKAAKEDRQLIHEDQIDAATVMAQLTSKHEEATSVLEHCHSAYAAATSQGLAAAFAERSKGLATSMWVWTAAFVVALVIGAIFGTQRVHEIGELLKNPAMTNWALGINLLLAALSVGAPIWFGWMATKQINQRFRLSEDYAFKAAVSRAYEGYRKEAARIDKDMEARLLASALTRLDEQPLRFVEATNHGTPLQELASSDVVKSALSSIPGFADKVIDLARAAVQSRAKPAANDEPKSPVPTAEAPKA